MMSMELSFIIIDENELDCFIAQKIIKNTNKNLGFKTFQNAQHALEVIRENSIGRGELMSVILLDLQMPLMDGFQFVEEFEKLSPEIQKKYTIDILSSTRNATEISRILTHDTVNSVIEKPLTKEKLISLLMQISARS